MQLSRVLRTVVLYTAAAVVILTLAIPLACYWVIAALYATYVDVRRRRLQGRANP
jgi:hypothetical protein